MVPTPSAFAFDALGGTCELYAYGPIEPLPATAEWIRGLHARFTRFDPASELSRFNASAGRWVPVSPELQVLLQLALSAFEESGGLVNAAVLPALVAAGYDRPFAELSPWVSSCATAQTFGLAGARAPFAELSPWTSSCATAQTFGLAGARAPFAELSPWASSCGVPGNPHQIDADPHQIGAKRPGRSREAPLPPLPDLLRLRADEARLAPGAAIDLGGIAKGWIADRAVERMGPNSLASCGGDLYARGAGPTGEGWPVAFADRTLLLADRAAATSGTTKRRWGDGRHHLIDPRTGVPAITDLREVSVLAGTAADAEILAKTALLLGSLMAPSYLETRSAGWALA